MLRTVPPLRATSRSRLRETAQLALPAGLIAAIFILDTFTLLGSAVAVLYVLPLLLLGSRYRGAAIKRWAATCAALAAVSFLIGHLPTPALNPTLRLLVSLAANLVTTLLILRSQSAFASLRASERRYRTTFETLAVAILEHDVRPVAHAIAALRAVGVGDIRRHIVEHPEFVREMRAKVRITDVNDTAVRLLGAESKWRFFSHLDALLPDHDESFAEFIVALDERRTLFQHEASVVRADGATLRVIVAMGLGPEVSLERVPGTLVDMTDRIRLAEMVEDARIEVDRVQRAAVMAQMSASIAHEINQPLAAIRTYADAARRWLERDPPARDEATASVQRIVDAVAHAYEVIRRLRALTGREASEAAPLCVDTAVRDAAMLLQREIAENDVRLELDLDAAAASVLGDRILVQQVLVNLISNAIQAMRETAVGARLVTIATSVTPDAVILSVADRGPGWPEGKAERMFDPFRTTKADGMGLGLAICRSVVDAHDGSIRACPAPDGGAMVRISLPRACDGGAAAVDAALARLCA